MTAAFPQILALAAQEREKSQQTQQEQANLEQQRAKGRLAN